MELEVDLSVWELSRVRQRGREVSYRVAVGGGINEGKLQ